MANKSKKSEMNTIIIVDSLLFFINVQKDTANWHAFNKLILDYTKEENILAAKECLHEKLNTTVNRLVRRRGLNGATKNLED